MIKRNLKILGLALMAAFALSALVTSAAQGADRFTAESFPLAVTGHQEGSVNFIGITENRFRVTCGVATYEGTLTGSSEEITIFPHYEKCLSEPLGVEATIHLRGCDYRFTVGATIQETNIQGSAHLVCPAGKQIEVTLGGLCTIDIAPQAVNGITYTNKPAEGEATPKKYITVDVNSTDLKYKETTVSIFCPLTNNFEGADGTFFSSIYMKGYQDLGTHVGAPTGLSTNTEGNPVGIDVGSF